MDAAEIQGADVVIQGGAENHAGLLDENLFGNNEAGNKAVAVQVEADNAGAVVVQDLAVGINAGQEAVADQEALVQAGAAWVHEAENYAAHDPQGTANQ